jgi:TorA maturation chaperone TorD
MTDNGMSIGSASAEPVTEVMDMSKKERGERDRMLTYKSFAVAFSYPDDQFLSFFKGSFSNKELDELKRAYDGLFRASEVWLYGTEHLAKNEFQRSNELADIMGFYRAFGVEPDRDRPDSLSGELEFMHYLIFKRLHALKNGDTEDAREKARICQDAERKFFRRHVHPAATKIAEAILAKSENGFYRETAQELLEFLESDERFLGRDA